MNIVGVSAFYHDSSCCLLRNGKLVAAVQEERFSRLKHDRSLPVQSFRYCLKEAGLGITDIDCLAYYELPAKKRERQVFQHNNQPKNNRDILYDPVYVEEAIRKRLGYEGSILYFEHHHSHAASAFYFSGFEEAAILTVDGVGEWATTTYGIGRGASIDLFDEVHFPHSLGLFYATLTAFLGFKINDGEYKVMGLAAYGKPRYVNEIRTLIKSGVDGQFQLNLSYFDFVNGQTMYSQRLAELLGGPPRQPGSDISIFHKDVAKSTQQVLEEILLEKVAWLAHQVDTPNLCMAGGVALNCVANGRILREGPFKRLFVQPASGDAGCCLGAAALAHVQLTGHRHSYKSIKDVFLGPGYSENELGHLLRVSGFPILNFIGDENTLLQNIVDRLVSNKVIGWFQGRMEFGPRALGARCILANPMDESMRDKLNTMIKKRESFRPFAPSVLDQHASTHFDLSHSSPFMLETCQIISPLQLPGVKHIDNSARPQTVSKRHNHRFAALIDAFYLRTGCPILVNTSFNVNNEPIVCTPADALFCMIEAKLDCLVLGDYIIDKESLQSDLAALTAQWQQKPPRIVKNKTSPLQESLYSFV